MSWLALISAALAASLVGCVQVDGGAVELSWKVRTTEGTASSCVQPEPDIARMRVCWELTGAGGGARACRTDLSSDFPCADEHGITGFVIDDGRWDIWIEPLCLDGLPAAPDRYDVPPPIVRDIARGEVATLNALLLVAQNDVCVR